MLGYIEREYYIMNGWIIHKKALGENLEVQRLVEEFEKRDIKVRVVNPQDVDIFVDVELLIIFNQIRKIFILIEIDNLSSFSTVSLD